MEPGTVFLEYTIEHVLGAGNFGIVYKAANRFLDETVAIKEFFPRELAYRSQDFRVLPRSSETERTFHWALNRFLKEARILWSLSRPNPVPSIIQVKSYREENGTAYMIMEYAEGEPLSKLIERNKTLTHDQIELILNPLLDGLERVHNASVLHRDIKPSNMLIRSDGSPVLIDFGAAKPDLDRSAKSTMVVYTPMYAPPEQIVSEGKLGAWTDIYSLGATLYHAVAGRPPINPVTRIQGLEHMPAVEAGADRYPENLLKAIDAAIEPIYTQRPQTIAALRNLIYPPMIDHALDATIITSASPPYPSQIRAETVFPTVPSPLLGAGLLRPDALNNHGTPTNRIMKKGDFLLVFLVFLFGVLFYLSRKPTIRVEIPESRVASRPNESLALQVNQRLVETDCALLESRLKPDDLAPAYSLEIAGHMADAESLRQLKNSIGELSRIKNIKTDIELDLEPFCEVIRLYKHYQNIRSGSNHVVVLGFNHPDRIYTNGDLLFINATSNTRSKGYLYVDFFDREGNVVHMLPSPFNPTNSLKFREEIFLGEKRKVKDFENKRSYVVLPPFGTHIVTTLFSESRLFDDLRPESEAIEPYLKAMEPILRGIPDAKTPRVSIEIIKTRDST
ncbi:MAG: protein kinase domain-containing protein [Methylococcales bacterium]